MHEPSYTYKGFKYLPEKDNNGDCIMTHIPTENALMS